MENIPKEKVNQIECIICLEPPKLPVATPCGHIFCWDCLQSWERTQPVIKCPVCHNGFELNKVIKLFMGNDQKDNKEDTRPKAEHIDPVKNTSPISYFNKILRNFGIGVSYIRNTESSNDLPPIDAKEVNRNRLALVFFIIGVYLIYSIFH